MSVEEKCYLHPANIPKRYRQLKPKTYPLSKTCQNGHEIEYEITKREAAFDQRTRVYLQKPCPTCGEREYSSASWSQPAPDRELLLEWGNDLNLWFDAQDEEIVMAAPEKLELYVEFIDGDKILNRKRLRLIEVLFIMFFDASPNTHESADIKKELEKAQLRERIKKILLERMDLVKEAEPYIWGYVKQRVLPELGIPYERKS